jgi:Ni,Fe-hydrogenase maturation factor
MKDMPTVVIHYIIAVIEPEHIPATLVSTHVLPLSVVMEYVERETGAGVTLLGIQPDLSGADRDLTDQDLAYLDRNLRLLFQVIRNRQVSLGEE